MFVWIARWVINALAIYIVSRILPGIRVTDFGGALVAAILLGLVNVLIKPVLLLLTLPITILTFGLFALVINAFMLVLVSYFTPGFKVDGFWTAFVGSILISIVSSILNALVKSR